VIAAWWLKLISLFSLANNTSNSILKHQNLV
jgi:hypothetical protein